MRVRRDWNPHDEGTFATWAEAVAFAKACARREGGYVTVRWEDAEIRAAGTMGSRERSAPTPNEC